MKWVKPEHGPARVDAAGKVIAIRRNPNERMNMDEALSITGNLRSWHAYPLHALCVILRDRAKRIDPEAMVVQRLKRMPSIVSKLRRFERMQLSQMQDLGGCRAIMSTVEEVTRLVALYESSPCTSAVFCRKNDYISQPKGSGYRGVHLIYEYQSTHNHRSFYNG